MSSLSLDIILFFSTNVLTFSFLVLALKWPKLMEKWQLMEKELSKYCDRKQKRAYINEIRFVAATILIIGLSNF